MNMSILANANILIQYINIKIVYTCYKYHIIYSRNQSLYPIYYIICYTFKYIIQYLLGNNMLEQHCRNCKNQYDYFARTATIVCNQNHVLCKMCAQQLSRCPFCHNPNTTSTNPYANTNPYPSPNINNSPSVNTNPYANNPYPLSNPYPPNQVNYSNQNIVNGNNAYWQPVNPGSANNFNNQPYQYQPYPANLPNNQGFNPVPAQQSKSKGFCILAFLFIVGFGILLGMRTQMDRCEYWHYQTCYFYQIGDYRCCDAYYSCPTSYYNCYYLTQVQNRSSMLGTTVGCSLCAAFAFIFFVAFINARKRDAANLANGQAVYVRA